MASEAEDGNQLNLDRSEEIEVEVSYDPEDFTEAEADSPTANDTRVQEEPKPQRRLWKSPVFIIFAAFLCTFSVLIGKASVGIEAHKQAAVQAAAKSGKSPKSSNAPKSGKSDCNKMKANGKGKNKVNGKGKATKSGKGDGNYYTYGYDYYYYYYGGYGYGYDYYNGCNGMLDPDFEEDEFPSSDASN